MPCSDTVLHTGAALGPLLAGLISPTGWNNVFYMLISADVLACLVRVLGVHRWILRMSYLSRLKLWKFKAFCRGSGTAALCSEPLPIPWVTPAEQSCVLSPFPSASPLVTSTGD